MSNTYFLSTATTQEINQEQNELQRSQHLQRLHQSGAYRPSTMMSHVRPPANMMSQVRPPTDVMPKIRQPTIVMTSQSEHSTHMTSQIRHQSPYDYPTNTPPSNNDVMPNMR